MSTIYTKCPICGYGREATICYDCSWDMEVNRPYLPYTVWQNIKLLFGFRLSAIELLDRRDTKEQIELRYEIAESNRLAPALGFPPNKPRRSELKYRGGL